MAWLFRDRYECQHVLGQGGFGKVWRAYDRHLDREVALKLFPSGFPLTDAFLEAQLLTQLRGDHILQVLNADVYVDIPYVVTEVAEHRAIENHILPRGVAAARAIRWVSQLLVGLDVVHAAGLVHRDVKPSNLFLETLDHARLGDFGVAARAGAGGMVARHGDPRVVAPEMWATGTGTIASDIYSSGVTLYAALTGTYPITGATLADIAQAATTADYRPLRDVAPHVPATVAVRVRKAMALNPADRFPSAREMRESLTAIGLHREWSENAPHPGHHRCWSAPASVSRPSVIVCVMPSALGGFDIETRRATGAETRILAGCIYVRRVPLLATRLRRIFTDQ